MATRIPDNDAAFSLSELLAITGGVTAAGDALAVTGVCTDTRALRPGQLFVALSGERFDGHEHLAAAASAGATLALVEREVSGCPLPTLRVSSTLDALGALGAYHVERWRNASSGRVVALTGSAGKTTTKAAIGALVEQVVPGALLLTEGNLNNRIGVPMTAFGLRPHHRVAVFEVGTNAPGEIAKLARIVRPDIGLITLIAVAHTEGLGGIEGVAREKAALFDELTPEHGIAIGNGDDVRVSSALLRASVARRISYGAGSGATYRIGAREVLSPLVSRVVLSSPRGTLTFSTPLLGEAGALACAAAVATTDALGMAELDEATIEAALATLVASGRMQPRELSSGLWLIDDSYNSNPASCRSSIGIAHEIASRLGRRLVLVLGEMRELGTASPSEHEQLGEEAARRAGLVVAVSGDARHVHAAVVRAGVPSHFVADAAQAAELALSLVTPDDVVLVKGSRGVRTERVVEAIVDEHDAPTAERGYGADGCSAGSAGGAT